ncbi:hypothetical protein [Glycomyces sp. MUSA5-2]|uniref:hypothetical protein n=1 Tax=Glycomyces sp. MUSA5-2 TaxID=2053002 RepID=UPI0030080391
MTWEALDAANPGPSQPQGPAGDLVGSFHESHLEFRLYRCPGTKDGAGRYRVDLFDSVHTYPITSFTHPAVSPPVWQGDWCEEALHGVAVIDRARRLIDAAGSEAEPDHAGR